MNIGIIFDKDISAGGGFQIEFAIISAIHRFAGGSGHKFFIYTPANNARFVKESSHIQLRTTKFTSLKYRILDFICRKAAKLLPTFYFKKVVKLDPMEVLFDRDQIDLVYFLGPHHLAPRQTRPYIFTVWDLQHRLQPEFPETSEKGLWEQRESLYTTAIGKSFAVIADSIIGCRHVERLYAHHPEKIFSLPFIHNYEGFEKPTNPEIQSVLQKYSLKPGFIFYPAQFWPHKNHIVLIEALKILKERDSMTPTLVLSGAKNRNFHYINGLVQKYWLMDQVHFVGFLDAQDIPVLYGQASMLAMPTFFGPTNIPVYEAFYFGCPVISSDIEGIREQIGNDGLCADPLDPLQWAEQIKKLYDDESLRDAFRQRGLNRAKAHTQQHYWQSLEKIFKLFEQKRRCWATK